MNQRTRQLLRDLVFSVIVSGLLTILSGMMAKADWGTWSVWPLFLNLGPIIWFSLRHGVAGGVVVSGLVALIQPFVLPMDGSYWVLFIREGVPLFSGALAGLFARNTQRTLNNYRYSSTYLNIVTATIVSVLVAAVVRYSLVRFVLGEQLVNVWGVLGFWLGLLVAMLIISLILTLPAKPHPSFLITHRSKYLPRRETTSLLND